MTGRPKVFFRSEVWEKKYLKALWRYFRKRSWIEVESEGIQWAIEEILLVDTREWLKIVDFERGLALSQFYISQLKRWCFKSISRMSSVRNELESCSELFIHITGWSDSKRKILLDGKKLRNRTQITYVYLRYLQSKTAADSRELINRKFDFCQVNLRRSFQCTTVIPTYLNMMFETHW